MLTALNAKGEQVLARDVNKQDGPFSCPECGGEVTLKKGEIIFHHFAHVPSLTCTFGVGESDEHQAAKLEIHDALLLSQEVKGLMIERVIKNPSYTIRLDVSGRVRNKHFLTVEYQKSKQLPKDFRQRTERYTAKGIYVLWLLPYPEDLFE